MSCRSVLKSLSAYLDVELREAERSSVSQHLSECAACAARSEQIQRMRVALRSIPRLAAPERLAVDLRVLASRERARRASRLSLSAFVNHWSQKLGLVMNNLLRPIALPLAGGLTSAALLFAMLVPTLAFKMNLHNDRPTMLGTEASVDMIPPFCFTTDVTIDLRINEQGQVIAYSIPKGKLEPREFGNVSNLILFSSFNPATYFGQPLPGNLRISLRRRHIVIKG